MDKQPTCEIVIKNVATYDGRDPNNATIVLADGTKILLTHPNGDQNIENFVFRTGLT